MLVEVEAQQQQQEVAVVGSCILLVEEAKVTSTLVVQHSNSIITTITIITITYIRSSCDASPFRVVLGRLVLKVMVAVVVPSWQRPLTPELFRIT